MKNIETKSSRQSFAEERHKLFSNLQRLDNYQEYRKVAEKMDVPVIDLTLELIRDAVKGYTHFDPDCHIFQKARIFAIANNIKYKEFLSAIIDDYLK